MLLFFDNKVSPIEATPAVLLRQFVMEIDRQLTELGVTVINGPDLNVLAFELEMRAQENLISSQVKTIQTDKGPLHTTSSYQDIYRGAAITLATCDEVMTYYQQMGEVVLQRKKANCVGMAAATLLLARSLAGTDPYRSIETQLCQLKNWGHVLVRFKHQNEPQGLFYDPWYQRGMAENPAIPFIIEEHEFESNMQTIVGNLSFQSLSLIYHTSHLMRYNTTTYRLETQSIINRKYYCDYCVVCSTHTFSNPAKKTSDSPSAEESGCHCVIM
jgi:hypothetical protein